MGCTTNGKSSLLSEPRTPVKKSFNMWSSSTIKPDLNLVKNWVNKETDQIPKCLDVAVRVSKCPKVKILKSWKEVPDPGKLQCVVISSQAPSINGSWNSQWRENEFSVLWTRKRLHTLKRVGSIKKNDLSSIYQVSKGKQYCAANITPATICWTI